MPRYKPMRQRRINRLVDAGFTHKEAVGLTGLRHNGKPVIVLKRKMTKNLLKARKRRDIGLKDYANDFLALARRSDDPEAWSIFRYYHRQAIDAGVMEETPRKYDPNKPHKKLTSDGRIDRDHIRRQAANYREKQRAGR